MLEIPTKDRLLSDLDSLPHAGRIHRVSLLGRDEAGPQLDPLLDELARGDAYEQYLGLIMSFAMQSGVRVMQALRSPSVYVQHVAATNAARYITDDGVIASTVFEASPAMRRCLLASITRYERTTLAENLFPRLLEAFGPKTAALVLPACSPQFLDTALDQHAFAVSSWRTLAKRRPQEVMAFLNRIFTKLPQRQHPALWARVAGAWDPLADYDLRAFMQIVTQYAPPDAIPPIGGPLWGKVTRQYPTTVFELLLRPSYRRFLLAGDIPKSVLKNLRYFTEDQITALARVMVNNPAVLAIILARLPPGQRGGVFRNACGGIDISNVIWPEALLEVLPHLARNNEVERMILLKTVVEDRDERLRITSLGSIDIHRGDLEKYATSSQAEDRMRAYAYLVSCTARNRRGLTETLKFLLRLKNDQDPVRSTALAALADCPPSLFSDDHVNALAEIVKFVAEARDTSSTTQASVLKLANILFKANAIRPNGALFQFSTNAVLQMAKKGGYFTLPNLDRDFPRGAEGTIVEVLLPFIRAASRRESYSLAVSLTRALGKRAWQYVGLQELLGSAALTARESDAYQPISLWLEAPKTREERVLQLLKNDPSVISHPSVIDHLVQRRQDLLDPFIDGTALKGRFLTGKTIYLLPVNGHFQWWLPRQQRTFALLLQRVIDDNERDYGSRVSAIRTLAKLPTSRVSDFNALLRQTNVNLLEATLGALPYLDNLGEVLAILLQFLDGDRARVAIYAVPRVAQYVFMTNTINALGEVLSRPRIKVTVQKEVLRLLGEHVVPENLRILKQIVDGGNAHRDVLIAVGHAARALTWVPGAWDLLTRLASSRETAVAHSLLLSTCDILALAYNRQYCALVLQVTKHPDLVVRRSAFNFIQNWAAGMEEQVASVAAEPVRNLDAPEWREATKTLVGMAQAGGGAGEILRHTVMKLLEMPVPDGMDGGSVRDLPSRQRLDALCQTIAGLPQAGVDAMKPALTAIAMHLENNLTFWPQALRVKLAIVDWTNTRAISDALGNMSQLSTDVSAFVQILRTQVMAAVSRQNLEPKVLLQVADDLMLHDTIATVLLALDLVQQAGSATSWDANCVQRIAKLRLHEDTGVRMLALQIWTRRE